MRRMLAVCAVAVMIFAAFALAQNEPSTGTIVVTGSQYTAFSYAARLSQPNQISTLTDNVSARSMAVALPGAGLPTITYTPTVTTSQNVYLSSSQTIYTPSGAILGTIAGISQVVIDGPFPTGVFQAGGWVKIGRPAVLPTVAGTDKAGYLGDGGAALSAELNLSTDSLVERSGIAIASDGTIYVADTKNGTIRSVAGTASSEPGIIRSVAGKWAARQNVTLVEPMGIAVDRAGNLYIADHGAGAVDVLVASTGQLETLAHVVSPASIAVTQDGTKLFVASPETGGVFEIAPNTRAIAAVPGFAPVAATASDTAANPCAAFAGATSGTTISTDVLAAASAQKNVCPAGLAVDGRANLFVADANAGKILRVDATTSKLTTAATGLLAPGDIAFDPKGDLFVSEQGRSRIIAFGQMGDPLSNLTLTAPAPPAGCAQGISFTFCNEPSGGTTQTAAFTLTNNTSSTLAGIAITPPLVTTVPPPPAGNFTVESTTCTATLAMNSSCTINVAFTPLTTGAQAGTLTATDSASDSFTIDLAGTGDDYNLALASGQTQELTVAQGGTATFMAQVTSDSVFGANGEKVTFVCPATIPQFSTCSFTPCPIKMTPSTTTPFSIVIVTSSATKSAPPVTNPCGGAAAVVGPGVRGPGFVIRLARQAPSRSRGFSAPALLAMFLALALVAGSVRALHAGNGKRAPLIFGAAGLVALIFLGCGGHGNPVTTATPTGVTQMTMTANALDSNGNPLNASRPLPFTIDVVAGP